MRMLYVVKERKGAGMLTGDYGTGKTIITRILTQHMDSSKHKFVFLTNPQLTALDFVEQ